MGREVDSVIELVMCASELVDRHRGLVVAHPSAIRQVTLLRDAVRDSADACPEGVATGDLDDLASDLDALLERLERLPEPAPALTG